MPSRVSQSVNSPVSRVAVSEDISVSRRQSVSKVISKQVSTSEVKPISEIVSQPEPSQPVVPDKKNQWSDGKILLLLVAAFAVVALFGAVIFGLMGEDPEGKPSAVLQNRQNKNVVSGECGYAVRWHLDMDTGIMTVEGNGDMYNFYLEEYDDGMRQDRVARPWEEYVDIITEVRFQGNVTRVGDAAFAHCANLTKADLSAVMQQVGGDAFWDTGLKAINLPNSLKLIEWSAFDSTQLENINLPMFLDYVGHYAFGNCPNLTKVEILGSITWCYDIWSGQPIFSREGNSVEGITIYAPPGGIAEDYSQLFGYNFVPMGSGVALKDQGDFSGYPGNVEGRWYFDAGSGFLKIEGEMPTDMLGRWELNQPEQIDPRRKDLPMAPWEPYSEEIRVVSIGEGVTRITDNAFAQCFGLTDIYLPSTLEYIGFQSFLDTGLDEIVIPDSVTEIHSFAFNYCRNLRTVKLPAGLERLEGGTFNVNPMLERVYVGNCTEFSGWENNGQRVTPFNNNDGEDERKLPANLTLCSPQGEENGIKSPAREFAEEYGLGYEEGLFRWDNLQHVGDVAFGKSTVSWGIQDGILILTGTGETPIYQAASQGKNNKGVLTFTEKAPWYPYRNEIHTVIVEGGITALNQGALCDMPNLWNVDLGNVEKLGEGAIDNCGMEYLELPQELYTIGKGAISDCANLRELVIHTGVDKVENGAIQGCYKLEKLWFWNDAPALNVNGDLFGGDQPENLTIYGKQGSPAEQYANNHGILYEIIW